MVRQIVILLQRISLTFSMDVVQLLLSFDILSLERKASIARGFMVDKFIVIAMVHKLIGEQFIVFDCLLENCLKSCSGHLSFVV